MARLIDADAAKRKAIVCTNAAIEGDESEEMLTFMRTLQELLLLAFDDAPTIEAEPVRHGRWEDRRGLLMPMHRYDKFTNPNSIFNGTCSVCGVTVYQGGILNGFNYCPHCGAKMDKDGQRWTRRNDHGC